MRAEFSITTYMSDVQETFFTAVGCMDGRVQSVIAKFGQDKFHAEYQDTITEAGLVGVLAKDDVDPKFMAGITTKVVAVSIGKHHSAGVVVHGHQECAGNPVSETQHIQDIKKSVEVISALVGKKVPVVGVFVKRSTKNPRLWRAKVV